MRTAGDVNVEAVELCRWGDGPGEIEQPDSVRMRVLRAMILFEEKDTQARCMFSIADMTGPVLIELTMYVPGSRAHVCNFRILDC